MAGYQNNISLGIKLQPSKEVQTELETVIGQLEKNSSLNLTIDTKQINQSLKEFGDTLSNITSQIKSSFNLQGVFTSQVSGIENVTSKLKEEKNVIDQTANSIKTLSNTKIAILNDDGSIKETLKEITKVEEGIGKIQTLTKDGKTGIVTAKFEDNSETQRKAEQEKQDILKQEIEAYRQIDVLKRNGIINESDITKLEKMVREADSLKDMKSAMNSIMNTSMMNESSILTISKQLEDAQNKLNKMKQSFNDKLLPNGFIESTEIEINKLKEDLKNVDGMNFNGIKDSLNQVNNTIKLTNDNAQMLTKLENTTNTLQTKLNTASNNEFINPSVITNLQSKLNSINTNTADKEIKELQTTIANLGSSDSQIVRLQNTISKMENNLTSMKGKYGSLVGDSSSKSELASYISQVEKLKAVLTSLQSGGTISGQKLASELNSGTNASRELSTAVKNSSNALKLAQNDANSFSNSIKKAFENAGIYMSVYQVINMMANAFKNGVQDVISMDTALGNLNKVVSMSSSQLIQMRDSAIEMGKELGRSSIEVANAQAEFGRLYKTQSEINSMTKVSVMGANVMDGVSSAEVAKGLTTIVSSMKLEAKDSMGILDSMNEIQNNYRVGASDLLNALAEVGSTAYTSGANLQKVEGYITSIAVSTGQSGDEVGNALRSVMSRIYKIGTEGIESAGKPEKMLKDMGVAVRDSSGQFKEFSVIMDDLNSKWGNYSRTQQIAIAQSVAGVQRYNQFLALMQNYGMATDATNTALNSQGSALKENEIHMQTAEAKLGTLKATTEAFYMKLINSDAIKTAIDGLTSLVSTFGNLPTIIGLTTSAIVAFGGKALISAIANVGGYITSLISLASTEGVVATATTELSLAMSTNPFGLIAIAIAGLTVGFVSLNHSFEESTNYIGKINEATKGLQELKSTENLVKQYNDLNATISSTSSTVEQVTSAKEKLLGVQKQLASQNPDLVDGYTKEGDALVRNIKLIEEKITKDKKALGAEAESNYGKLINQVNSKQMNKFTDTATDSVWWLPGTWKSDIETYNNLIKQSENSENGLSESRKNKLNELSTKFGDLNKAIVTMKDNGQDISGKQMFDFSTGKLVDAVTYLKDIEKESTKTSDKTKLISQAMKELNSSTSTISSSSIDALNKAFPNMGINADNAKEKIKNLNDEINDGKTDSIDNQTNAIAEATKEYGKSTEAIAKMQGYLDKINKTHSLTPTLVAQISKAYPELASQVGNVTQLEESLKQKIQEQADSQLANYEIMMGSDQEFYSQKIKNNQSFEDSLNTFLNSFVTNSQDSYNIDTNNYKTLNELKQGIQGDFGESINQWLSQYVDTSASGYQIDLSNFKSLAEAKQGILKILKGEIDKLNQAMATMTQNIADQAKTVANASNSNSVEGLNAEKLYGKDIQALQSLADKQKQVQGGINDFNASFDKFGIAEKGLSGGNIGYGGTATPGKDTSKADAKKAEEELVKSEKDMLSKIINAYDDAKSQIDDDINEIDANITLLGEADNSNFPQRIEYTTEKIAKQKEEMSKADDQLQALKNTTVTTSEAQKALTSETLKASKEFRTQKLEVAKLTEELVKLNKEQASKIIEKQKELATETMDTKQEIQTKKLDDYTKAQETAHNELLAQYDAELKALEDQKTAEDNVNKEADLKTAIITQQNDLLDKQNSLKQAQINLERAQNQKTVYQYTKQEDGSYQFQWKASDSAVKTATDNVKSAQDAVTSSQASLKDAKKSLETYYTDLAYEISKAEIEAKKTTEDEKYKLVQENITKISDALKSQQEKEKKQLEYDYADITKSASEYLAKLNEQYGDDWKTISETISKNLDEIAQKYKTLQYTNAYGTSVDKSKLLGLDSLSNLDTSKATDSSLSTSLGLDTKSLNLKDTSLIVTTTKAEVKANKEALQSKLDDTNSYNEQLITAKTDYSTKDLAVEQKHADDIIALQKSTNDTQLANETVFLQTQNELTEAMMKTLLLIYDESWGDIVNAGDLSTNEMLKQLQIMSEAYNKYIEMYNKMHKDSQISSVDISSVLSDYSAYEKSSLADYVSAKALLYDIGSNSLSQKGQLDTTGLSSISQANGNNLNALTTTNNNNKSSTITNTYQISGVTVQSDNISEFLNSVTTIATQNAKTK
jgi:TP901 family phage tail tape measure protein